MWERAGGTTNAAACRLHPVAPQASLAAAKEELAGLRGEAAAAATLRRQLDAAQQQLAGSKGQADEVDYLQQQVGYGEGACARGDLGEIGGMGIGGGESAVYKGVGGWVGL